MEWGLVGPDSNGQDGLGLRARLSGPNGHHQRK